MASADASNGEELLEVLLDKTHTTILRVEKDTFIPNIMGYACPVPAINLSRHNVWNRALRHNQYASFGVKSFALQIKDPNMRFCDWPSAASVFGEEFKAGAEVKLEIRTIRELIKLIDHAGVERTILRETISSSLNNKELFSKAQVDLTARQ
jgi:hypothetical protein